MPAIRDWSYNYISTAGTSIICDAPETVVGDLMVAELTCKTAPNTVTAPASTGESFSKVLSYGIGVISRTLYCQPSNGVTISAADGTSNLPAGAPSTNTTAPSKAILATAEIGTAAYFAPTAPTQNVATIMQKWYFPTTLAYDVDISAIAYSIGLRVYNTTDTCSLAIYGHNPAGAANNKTLIATSTTKTPGVITLAQQSWIAANFTINGTGRLTAGYMLLVEFTITRVGTTTTAPRFYYGIAGATSSQNITYTATMAAAGYIDQTTEAADSVVGDVTPTSALITVINDAFYFGYSATFTEVYFVCSTAGTGGTSASTWEYWNGSAWTTLSTTTDTTTNWRLSTGNQSMTFTAPGGWTSYTVNGSDLYWIRSRVTTGGTFTAKPLLTSLIRGALFTWTQLYNVANTTSPAQVIYYRYAKTVEDATYTFTLTSSVCSMAILSIRDVHLTTPFNNGTGYATATNAALKAAMPTRTTTANNCLNLHFVSTSVATIPSIIEGPVTMLYGKDGGACSDGCGWSLTALAGTTPTVTMSRVAASADVLGTISVAPPAAGASVIPTYCSADASLYLTPINGTTAYNGDTAFAATATTYFGSSLNGRTLANGTAAAVADSGLNSYHSMGDCASGTVKGTWSGCTNVFVTGNKPNVNGKNVIIHTKPTLAVDLQTTVGIASAGVCGVAIGMCSTANVDYCVYHVSGGGTPYAANYQPIIMNSNYTGAGRINNTGTFAPSSVLALGFFVSGFLTPANWLFGSAWALGTTTIAGGNVTEPITPSDVAKIVADGHERMSVTRQGSNQILVFQPIQFGDGGTNPVYLGFSNSATEFPKQYDQVSKTTNYCAPDNVCGYTFYPGSGETIDIRGASFSSASRFHWAFHTSMSTSSVWMTTGASITGAGTVTLNKAVTFTGVTINDYSTLDVSGLTLTGSTIKNMPATNDSMTTSSSTAISTSTITTTTVTAGNRWCSVASPVIFSSNAFTGSHTTGHAIRISSTTGSPFAFSGNTFTTYGPTVFGFHTTTGVTDVTDLVTKTSHGYTTGDPVIYMKQGGTAAIGLTDATTYYVRAVSVDTIAFYVSSANASADTSRIALTPAGAETHYINSLGAAIFNDSGGAIVINVSGGVASPTIRNGANASTTVNNNVDVTVTILDQSGVAIPGVEVAIFQDNSARTVVLASTATNGSGVVTTTAANSLGAIIIRARQSTTKASFLTSVAGITDATNDIITTLATHKYNNGDAVVYSKNGGTAVVGLTAGSTYYVRSFSTTTLSLYSTAAYAIAGGATGRADLVVSGAETHLLDPVRYVANSATGTIGGTNFTTQITMITDTIATG
jgi:hypothetical protein